MTVEMHWCVLAIYIAVGLLFSISSLSAFDFFDEKEVRIFTILCWTMVTLFFAATWPLFLFFLLLNASCYEDSTSRQLVSKWWNKINIVLWRRK